MQTYETHETEATWLDAFVSGERYWPAAPGALADLGVPTSLLESLVCKYLLTTGTCNGRGVAEALGLPFRLLEPLLVTLRTQQIIVHASAAPFNDFYYLLTDHGQQRARAYQQACSYVGTVPVTLADYVLSVEAQCISTESPTEADLREACCDISVEEELFERIGPAVNSGAGMFLYGAPGNGKSTLARAITFCFGQHIWIPRVIYEDGQLVKLFDAAFHHEFDEPSEDGVMKRRDHDHRWVRIRRPTVIVGGELTMDNLELRHDPHSNVSEAPLQLKSNGGCLVIDDFGRQRIEPAALLNRWIVPLEDGHDFLTLATGKKIQTPFEQLIIFSTNLEPRDLVDEAFLRRIPFKVELHNPSEAEFRQLFRMHAEKMQCDYRDSVLDTLIEKHYRRAGRAMRRCHARDLLRHVRSFCRYKSLPFEMRPEYFDVVVDSYFTVLFGNEQPSEE